LWHRNDVQNQALDTLFQRDAGLRVNPEALPVPVDMLNSAGAVMRPAWGVSALLLAVSDALAARFASVTVRGELSGFTRAASGHCYFTLKDSAGGAASLRCAMFRRAAVLLPFQARDGQQVELRGRLAVYEARGELQMVAESMQLAGAGALYEEFLRLRARLEAQGLFAAERKRAMPHFPRCIALVTSASGAALHDVVTTLQRRAPQVQVVVCPTLVQGAEAPAAIDRAMAAANALAGADLILLCRGGGSLEDLWAFNDERVVRAVADSELPVLCGVGHETDVCLADLAADLRAATPTAAAELAAPARDELMRALQQRFATLQRRVNQRLDGAAQGLDHLSLRLQKPGHVLGAQTGRLAALAERHRAAIHQALRLARQAQTHLGGRLVRGGQLGMERQGAQVLRLAARLDAVDPHRVLARGYAWMADAEGRPVVSARRLVAGQGLTAVWSDGQAEVSVNEVRLDRQRPAGS
jgi:exodeoxyribonuclease VII large subunit